MTHEARRLDKFTYDIFQGKGWDNWVRVKQGRSSTYRIAGEKITHAELKDLHQILDPRMPITYGQPMENMLININAINTRS